MRWFAAEFLVVVSGVLVALMVNAWWTEREEAIKERQTLRRLHEEAEASVAYLKLNIEQREALIRLHEAAVAALESGSTTLVDTTGFRDGIFFAFTYPSISPPRSVYDEITGAGLFGSLSSMEVRAALSAYYSRLNEVQNLLAFFRQTAQTGLDMTMEYPVAYDPASPSRMRVAADPKVLQANPRVQNLLIIGLRNQIAFQNQRRGVYGEAVQMCRALAEALGERCESAPAP